MSKDERQTRDMFAAHALCGLVSNPKALVHIGKGEKPFAIAAYALADAMLAARTNQEAS